MTFFRDDVLDVLIVSIQRAGVVCNNSPSQHPLGFRHWITCRIKSLGYHYSWRGEGGRGGMEDFES